MLNLFNYFGSGFGIFEFSINVGMSLISMNELNPVKPMLELLPLRLDPITVLINYSQMKYLLTTLLLLFSHPVKSKNTKYQVRKRKWRVRFYEEQEKPKPFENGRKYRA